MPKGIVKKLRKLPPAKNEMPSIVIAVDGRGGSGKTTFAYHLALELDAEIVHTDDFASWENKFNWVPDFIKTVLEPIRQGVKKLSYHKSIWDLNRPVEADDPKVKKKVKPIIIVEGVSSSRQELRDYATFTVYVDMSLEECFKRRLKRERENPYYPDLTDEEKIERWKEWVEEEDLYLYLENPKDFADVVIDGHLEFGEQLGIFKQAVTARLQQLQRDNSEFGLAR